MSKSELVCPHCMTSVHPAARVCSGCGAVKSNWTAQGQPVVPFIFLGLIGAYLLGGPFLLYSYFSSESRPEMLPIGLVITILGVFPIKWYALWASEMKWFRRN